MCGFGRHVITLSSFHTPAGNRPCTDGNPAISCNRSFITQNERIIHADGTVITNYIRIITFNNIRVTERAGVVSADRMAGTDSDGIGAVHCIGGTDGDGVSTFRRRSFPVCVHHADGDGIRSLCIRFLAKRNVVGFLRLRSLADSNSAGGVFAC